jgi:aldehyde dehydrogenase (NAD+)
MHVMAPQLPFGGVGPSGMGAYHGRWGFEVMSHRRAVLAKRSNPDLRMFYPPYGRLAMKIMRKVF